MYPGEKLISGPTRVYSALALANATEPDDMILQWLIQTGHVELTICPWCHQGDFLHTRACTIGIRVANTSQAIEWLAKKGAYAR
jgi:hypothetical protein